jgi:holin-like protein
MHSEKLTSPVNRHPLLRHWRALPGFCILTAVFLTGEWLKSHFKLMIPGNILGLFILLGLLLSGALPVLWVKEAAACLLWLLPLLFLPVFALSAEDKSFWLQNGAGFFAATALGIMMLWALVGRMAQFFLRRSDEPQ